MLVASHVGQSIDDALPALAGTRQELRRLKRLQLVQVRASSDHIGLRLHQLRLRARRDDAGADRSHHVLMHALCLGHTPAAGIQVRRGALERFGCSPLESREGGLAQQILSDARQQGMLERGARHAQPGRAYAIPAILVPGAAVPIAVDDHHRATAVVTAQQAAQQVLRRPAGAGARRDRTRRRGAADPGLCSLPRRTVDDRQLQLLGGDPFRLRPFLAHATPGLRVLHPVTSVPDLAADIDGVGQDADAAPHVAVDHGHGPLATAWRAHALGVQRRRDLPRAAAVDVFGVDPAHHGRLRLVDLALPVAQRPVSIGQAAGAGARERAPSEAAVGLLGQVIQVQLRHQAAQAGVELVVLACGVDAITHADQAHAAEAQALDHHAQLFLVAPEARQVIDQDHVEQVRVAQQLLVSGAIQPRAAHGGILVHLRRGPALPGAEGSAVPELVLEAGFPLAVGAETGVCGCFHRGAG
ncbi:hypothetical protein NC595_18190 [Dyella sp. Sa]|uniref:Uncharacterized protein n=1 Tax=Dyella lutea TaxID=2950441 RepID=A0ABT1FF14_9GAMM|nr:hypothetical protein [Dyella lutea]MCP1375982.1 hypothetical protein [Dyella lutea]